jgi:XTP/dITP diphosphohydrolase
MIAARTLLVATTNPNKVREIRPLFKDVKVDLLTLRDIPPVREPEETETTFWENARIKALGYAETSGLIVVAEDSGLEIESLGGEPGVQSARFLGANVPYPDRFDEIYRRLAARANQNRDARFVTALTVAAAGRILFETEAAVEGEIAPRPAGEHGFGYDPIFYYSPLKKTTAEMTLEEKSAVSHRARAFRDFIRWLRHSKLS